MTQARLSERLGVSPATVSRWIQGKHEPTAEGYVALGNLAPRRDAVYFWERAGMDVANLPDASLHRATSSLRVNLEEMNVVAGKRVSKQWQEPRAPWPSRCFAPPLMATAFRPMRT